MRRAIRLATVTLLTAMPLGVAAQWQGYKTPRIPRTADGKVDLSAPAPTTADGQPDLNGIWLASRAVFDMRQAVKAIPLSPEGKAIFDQRQATQSKDDPSARCLPTGLPVRALLRTPFKIVQSPGTTAILYESGTRFRQVLTDGRPLPQEIDWPAWQGFSIGRWEKDTFVITTGGFNGKAWLDQAGHPGSDAMTITERFRRRDFGHMDMEMIVDDRKMYTRPWSITAEFILQADTELLEFICEENERDSAAIGTARP
jgi:hypothetical protein